MLKKKSHTFSHPRNRKTREANVGEAQSGRGGKPTQGKGGKKDEAIMGVKILSKSEN